ATRGAWPPWLGTTVVLGTVGLYAGLLFLPRLSAPALALSRRLREMPAERLFVYWEKPSAAGGAWLLSLLVHLCVLAAHVSLSAALGLGVPAAAWLVIYPVTSFVAFLPISLNGVGPREAAYIYLIGLMGVGREQALSLGIMWFSLVLASGLVGGAFYLFGGELRVTDAVRT
ncbi:MAG: flippase-like domain-containing protein, partial [bacterium]